MPPAQIGGDEGVQMPLWHKLQPSQEPQQLAAAGVVLISKVFGFETR